MKIIITTSDNYHHALRVFCFLFDKQKDNIKLGLRLKETDKINVEVVGYKKPQFDLPDYFKFVSLGTQRGPNYFAEDLIPYFQKQDKFFIWMMEDMFIKSFYFESMRICLTMCHPLVGRINLSGEATRQLHKIYGSYLNRTIYENLPIALYRLSTQPSIWNKDFLLKYLKHGLSPWKFETQETTDDYLILGLDSETLEYTEGVRKHNINQLNLKDFPMDWIDEMINKKILNSLDEIIY